MVYLERQARERVGPPFGFTDEQWAHINRRRAANGEAWLTAEEWAAIPLRRRDDLCLNLPKAAASSQAPAPVASVGAAVVRDGIETPRATEAQRNPLQRSPIEAARAVFQVDPSVPATALVTPRELALSDLFAARKCDREMLDHRLMNTNDNVVLIASGEWPFQADAGVFMEIARMARHGTPARGTVCDLVAQMKSRASANVERRREKTPRPRAVQSTGGRSVASATEALERLSRCHINIEVSRDDNLLYSFVGLLIDKLTWIEVPGPRTFEASLDPAMSALFQRSRVTYLNPNVRCRLGHSPLALWLYGFARCHNLRFGYDIRYLHRISGSKCSKREFPRLLREAAEKLEEAKVLYTSQIKGGKLEMYRKKPEPARAASVVTEDGSSAASDGKELGKVAGASRGK